MTPPRAMDEDDLHTHLAVLLTKHEALEKRFEHRMESLEKTLTRLLWTVGGGLGTIIVIMLGYILSRIP